MLSYTLQQEQTDNLNSVPCLDRNQSNEIEHRNLE